MIGNSVWNSMVQLVFNMYIDDDVDVLAIQSAGIGVLIFCGTDKKNFKSNFKYTYVLFTSSL